MDYYKNLDLKDIIYFCEYDLVWKTEEWRDIVGYEGFYKISNLGRIKSLPGILTTKNGVIKPRYNKIKNQTIKSNGYLSVMLSIDRINYRFHVHRLVALAFIPNPENKPEVNHKKPIKTNNIINNLEWNTKLENVRHSVLNNLNHRGETSPNAKLTKEKVIALRRLYRMNPNFNKMYIAKKLGVEDTTIHKIIRNQRWKHL